MCKRETATANTVKATSKLPKLRMKSPTTRMAQSRQSIRDAVGLIREASPRLPVVLLAIAFVVALLAAGEVLSLRAVVAAIEDKSSALVGLMLFGLTAAGRRTLLSLSRELQWMVSEQLDFYITSKVIDVASMASFEDFEDPEFKDQLSRALNSARTKAWEILWSLVTMATSVLTSLALVVVLVTVAVDLLLPLGLAAVALLIVAAAKSRLTYSLAFHDTAPDRERRYLRSALTSREEGKEIRLFGSRGLLFDRHERLFRQRIDEVGSVVAKRTRTDLVGNAALTAALVAVLLIISRRTNEGSLTLADAAAAALAVQQLTSQLQSFANSAGSAVEASYFVQDVSRFIARLDDAPAAPVFDGQFEGLRVDTVSYRYPGATETALHDVSLDLSPGRIVAVVGENGSGKSTLTKIASGLYKPQAGSIQVKLDGAWRPVDGPLTGLVAAVFQDFARYELTVAENVWLGSPSDDIDYDRLRTALATMRLTQAIDELPDGIDSRLGRSFAGGLDLSIGQWQRLALARTIYSQAPIVLLDEPTSAADARAESDFFSNLRSLLADRAVMVVSHRFATVRHADEILVLNEGYLVERGTHAELMGLDGVYASMYQLQAERILGAGTES